MIAGTLDWEQPGPAIVQQVTRAAAGGSPLFSYLTGARIDLLAAALLPDADSADTPAGTIEAVEPGDGFVVVAGDGQRVRVTRYVVKFYVYETEDLAAVLEAFRLSLPQRLGRVPYLDNRDVTHWERGVRVWGIPAADWEAVEPDAETPHPSRVEIAPNLPYFRWLLTRLQVPPGARCLDVGCGDGWAMAILAELGYQVAGFDVAPGGLAVARRYVPGAHLAEVDYYEAGDYYARAGLQFDFILCRDLGIAWKLVDWFEPAWLEATRRLADQLTPGGVLYWTQLSDRTGTTTEAGFTNPPVETLIAYFRAVGLRPLTVGVFGGIFMLLLVRPEFPAARAEAFHHANARDWAAALERFRATEGAPRGGVRAWWAALTRAGAPAREPTGGAASTEADRQTIANACRAVCAHLSTLWLTAEAGEHRIVVAGTDRVARLYARIATALGVSVVAHWAPRAAPDVDGMPTRPVGWLPPEPARQPTAIVVAEPALERPAQAAAGAVPVLSVWSHGAPGHRTDDAPTIYLISGDQDESLLAGFRYYLRGLVDWPDSDEGNA